MKTPRQVDFMERTGVTAAPTLAAVPATPAGAPAGRAPLEYPAPGGEPWRCHRPDLMAADLEGEITAERLERMHAAAGLQPRAWLIYRRLYGVQPVIPGPAQDPDDLRTWRRDELAGHLGLERAQLAEEISRLRGIWQAACDQQRAAAARAEQARAEQARHYEAQRGELGLEEAKESLRRYGLAELVLPDEEGWMAARVADSVKMLEHPRAGELARNSLLLELELRRVSAQIARVSRDLQTTTDAGQRKLLRAEREEAMSQRSEMQRMYQDQLESLDKIFPWKNLVGGQLTAAGIFSDAIRAHEEWASRQSETLADGMFTAMEIQVLMRGSRQAPEPQYRMDVVAHVAQARHFLWDPQWKDKFPALCYKKLQAGFMAAAMEVSQANNEVMPDLTSDDPVAGEYAPLVGIENP